MLISRNEPHAQGLVIEPRPIAYTIIVGCKIFTLIPSTYFNYCIRQVRTGAL